MKKNRPARNESKQTDFKCDDEMEIPQYKADKNAWKRMMTEGKKIKIAEFVVFFLFGLCVCTVHVAESPSLALVKLNRGEVASTKYISVS